MEQILKVAERILKVAEHILKVVERILKVVECILKGDILITQVKRVINFTIAYKVIIFAITIEDLVYIGPRLIVSNTISCFQYLMGLVALKVYHHQLQFIFIS